MVVGDPCKTKEDILTETILGIKHVINPDDLWIAHRSHALECMNCLGTGPLLPKIIQAKGIHGLQDKGQHNFEFVYLSSPAIVSVRVCGNNSKLHTTHLPAL